MKNADYIKRVFRAAASDGQDKVVSLREALETNLKPGASVFLGWNANAAVCEIMRQYKGSSPGFTLVMSLTWDMSLNLVHCGLIKKLISGGCSYPAPNPAPSHVIQRAYREGTVEMENWTLYSIQQRLMGDDAEQAPHLRRLPRQEIAGQAHLAHRRARERRQDTQHRRLAGAVRTKQRHELSGSGAEVDPA